AIPRPQVKMEARMEVLARNDLFALGIQWGGGGLAVNNNATIVGRGFTSSPGVIGVQNSNNQLNSGGIGATGLGSLVNNNILVGTPAGTLLPVSAVNGLPNGGNVVNLPIGSILPGVVSAGTTVDLGASGGSPPAINKRKAETQVLIKEGERLVIGGVTNSESEEAVRRVPLMGDIPLFGWLFKQRGDRNQSTELVVFITPSIVRRDATT